MNKVKISHRIEEFFFQLGWTKAKFARAISEYPQHLGKVFTGKLDPLKYIDKLEEIGCDKNWLLTGKEPGEIDNEAKEPTNNYTSVEVQRLRDLVVDMQLKFKEEVDRRDREIAKKDKEIEKLRKEVEAVQAENMKLCASIALINSKGNSGSVK